MKKGTFIIITIILILAAIAAILWQMGVLRKWFMPTTKSTVPTADEKAKIAASSAMNDAKGFPLNTATKGAAKPVVQELQRNLNKYWETKLNKATFQGFKLPLAVDGIIGAQTWGFWLIVADKIGADTSRIDESDFNQLAIIVGSKTLVLNGKFFKVK